MRIVVDFQAAQTGSRYRGIGHYSAQFIKALVRNSPGDEFILALNGLFPETIEPIRADFDGILPQKNIRVWHSPGPIENFESPTGSLRAVAEIMREYFLRSLEPDLILVTSLFEGLGDNAVISVKKFVKDVPVAAIFYDFTPLYMPDERFAHSPMHRRWYRERIESLRQCDLLLCISESSRKELDRIEFPAERSVNVFGGRSEEFVRRTYSARQKAEILERFGIDKPYILYAGGVEANKNLKTLVEALSLLPPALKHRFDFVCVGKRYPGQVEQIQGFARDANALEMIKTVGFVDQSNLIDLYNCCDLFVFPSLREGFGLPPLEAMACGAPTIVSNRTSLPEVVDNADALFDPLYPRSIADKIIQILSDTRLRDALVEKGLKRAGVLSWDASAVTALAAIGRQFSPRHPRDPSRSTATWHSGLFKPNRKRILVMKLDHNGDFLLGVPAMAKLRARYPDARIDVLVGSWNRAAASISGLFDDIHMLDFFRTKSSLTPDLDEEQFQALLEQLPYYDYAIDFRRQVETRFILCRLNAHEYYGYRTGEPEIDALLTNPLDIHSDDAGERSWFDETHTCEQLLRIVDALPFEVSDYLHLPDLGERLPTARGRVAVFPRAGNDARQWDTAYFASLIDALAADGEVTGVSLYCGRAEELEGIGYRAHPKIKVNAGLAFGELFSSLSANQVCIGNNSFGVHLASYAGCLTIGIYSGHELAQQWAPPFGNSAVISVDAPCAPCHLPDRPSCPYDLFCLNDISVATVRSMVIDTICGGLVQEDYSLITRSNPATAIKPLVDAVNKSKFVNRIDGLGTQQRLAMAAAISVNFPERASVKPCVYVDVSALVVSNANLSARTASKLLETRALLDRLRRQTEPDAFVIPIAAGQFDHEFCAVDLDDLEESLDGSKRIERVVRPLAGDSYIGPDVYPNRNEFLWNLLLTWRQTGVNLAFRASDEMLDDLFAGNDDQNALKLHNYLFYITHFDVIVASPDRVGQLAEWIAANGPPRLRPIRFEQDWPIADIVAAPSKAARVDTVKRIRPRTESA